MSSLALAPTVSAVHTPLSILRIEPDTSTITAALAYAAAGWYVLPVRPTDKKHPGSRVGKQWQTKSSRDPEELVAWFAGTDDLIALHVGRSGAVVFDVDAVDKLPEPLAFLPNSTGPYQSTRTDEPGRGHYPFLMPHGRSLGNSKRGLPGGWGEVRGKNGVIIVAPSEHESAAKGARYAWLRTGPLTDLPEALAAVTADALDAADTATDAEVIGFLEQHVEQTRPELLDSKLRGWTAQLEAGESRHGSACGFVVGAMREARCGYYMAADATERMKQLFVTRATSAKPGDKNAKKRSKKQAEAEFDGILAWAIAQALAATDEKLDEVRERIAKEMPDYALDAWVPPEPRQQDDGAASPAAPAEPSGVVPDPAGTASLFEPYLPEMEATPGLKTAVAELVVRARAKEIFAETEQRKNPKPPPDMGDLAELLARPNTDAWRVEGLVPAKGRLLLSAQRKTGKTTFGGNFARALLTGEPLLGRFATVKLTGRVVVLNYEVSGPTFARWMDDIGVPHLGMYVLNLRGKRNLLADTAGREELVSIIRAQEGEVLMVDPFGRAYTGKSQNDTAEVTPWLGMLDTVAEDAGASEVLLTAHAGWNGERTRGSSGLEDWPDVIAWMTRDEDSDERFFRAEGRDVDVDEDGLHFTRETRTLSLSGVGSRKQVRDAGRVDELALMVAQIVREAPGVNVTGLREALRLKGGHLQREDAGAAARKAVDLGLVRTEKGARNSVLHFPVDVEQVSRPEPSRTVPSITVSRPDPSHRGGTTHTPVEGRAVPDLADAS